LLIAVATFMLGILTWSPFSVKSVQPAKDDEQIAVIYNSETCIPEINRYRINTKRGQLLHERLHVTEYRLHDVMSRSGKYSRKSQTQLQVVQRRLERELIRLNARVVELDDELARLSVRAKKLNGKDINHQICYEN